MRNMEIAKLRLEGKTLESIGILFNLTKERIRQILEDLNIQKPKVEKVKLSYKERIKQKIINNVEEDDNHCWLWQKGKTITGYGRISYGGGSHYAHRVSYQVFKNHALINSGVIKDDTVCVLHKCRNRNCVNPDHLYLGTQEDNARDRSLDKKNILR